MRDSLASLNIRRNAGQIFRILIMGVSVSPKPLYRYYDNGAKQAHFYQKLRS
tara:strand:+ start:1292 stop:1447 length:156 start_codon:yes stop_codon:yes gene_type:complete